MALYYEDNNISAERTGRTVTVPNNDVARLMYYLDCVCVAIDCNHDPDIQRFTSYQNWSYLSTDEQTALLVVCYAFSPDVLDDRVFFHSDALCGDSANEFYTINQVRNQVVAAKSIVIAGRVRQVNQIMTYKMTWMKTYYFDPMQRLVARLNAPPRPSAPPITYTSPTYRQSYTPPVIRQPSNRSNNCGCCCKCCSIFIVFLLLIGAGVGVYFILKQKGVI